MPVLTTTQRAALEKTVIAARRHAETGARNALRALAVDQPEPYAHTTPDQRALRNRLRAKARLLGDALQASGRQDIDLLAYELAYEYWHRMLFAKFLEANHLLMHSSGVAVTMDECAELAPEEGYADKWTAAAAYASRMLPAIFRPDDPLMQVDFATEDRIRLETLLDAVPQESFYSRRQPGLGVPVLAKRSQSRHQCQRRQNRRRSVARRDPALHRALHGAFSD